MGSTMLLTMRKLIMGSAVALALVWLWVDSVGQYRLNHLSAVPAATVLSPKLSPPEFLLVHGLLNRTQGRRDAAQKALQTAAIRYEIFAEAWIELAKIYIELDHSPAAVRVLNYLTQRFDRGRRWDRPLALLAHHLGDEKIFWRKIRRLTLESGYEDEAFQLADAHAGGAILEEIGFLDDPALISLHQWLIHGQRTGESLELWKYLADKTLVTEDYAASFAHYLLEQGLADEAIDVWPYPPEAALMTNPDFEKPFMGKGFGWRITQDKHARWTIRRIMLSGSEDNYVLEVRFAGKENLGFGHLFQLVPVAPGQQYQLSFSARGQYLTTDQRPFVEICRFDNEKTIGKSVMIPADSGWLRLSIKFAAPSDCPVIMVRLRRSPSHRFDNKIAGFLQLDRFELVPLIEKTAFYPSNGFPNPLESVRQ